MYGADCWTDFRLVISKLNLRIQPVRRPQGKKVPKKLDVSKLKQDSKRQALVNDFCSRLDALEHSSEDVDESWTVFRDTIHSSAMDSLGPVSRKHQDWFDDVHLYCVNIFCKDTNFHSVFGHLIWKPIQFFFKINSQIKNEKKKLFCEKNYFIVDVWAFQ